MAYLQRNAVLYIQKTRESSYNTPETTGSNYLRAVTDNNVVFIPNPEKRNDLGRAGSEFATGQCNTYWQPTAIAVAGEVDFNAVMARLWLRALGGTITDATVVTAAAFSHTAPMLPGSSGLQLPSFNALADIPGSGADYLYTGLVVDRARLSQDGAGVAQCSFDLIGSGKHRSPGNVSSLPSASSFTCVKPYAYLSYNNGGAIDLASGTCRVKSWFVELSKPVRNPNANFWEGKQPRCLVSTVLENTIWLVLQPVLFQPKKIEPPKNTSAWRSSHWTPVFRSSFKWLFSCKKSFSEERLEVLEKRSPSTHATLC
jgi:hypothetical protein